MNLLVKSVGRLAVLAVALFFFSCDDPSSIGFKSPTKKIDVKYVDLDVPSSVLSINTVKTANSGYSGGPERLLLGKYSDPVFGNITAGFYTQFFWTPSTALPADAQYDSASMILTLDNYHYGSTSLSAQSLSVYKLTGDIRLDSIRRYNNHSSIAYDPTPIGTKTYTIDTDNLDEFASTKATFKINVPLDYNFGKSIFDAAVKFSATTTTVTDSAYIRYVYLFNSIFKGIAVKSDHADKIVGINQASDSSRIYLHYHTATDTFAISYYLGVGSFSQVEADRQSSEVAGAEPFVDFYPSNNKRYIQSSTGLFTKLDLNNFLNFTDTVKNLVFNAAALVINDVEQSSSFPPPTNLALRVVDENNKEQQFSLIDKASYHNYILYGGAIGVDRPSSSSSVLIQSDNVLYVMGDANSGALLSYSADAKSYSGFVTNFAQQSFIRDDRRRYRYLLLYPVAPAPSKSLNRVVFPASGIKLRIYYTTPTTP
jgi:hypothetical protein